MIALAFSASALLACQPGVPPEPKGPTVYELAAKGDLKGLKTLLKKGADPNGKDIRTEREMMLAGHPPSGYTALHQAAMDGNVEVAKLLVSAGAKVDVRDRYRATPLHYAVASSEMGMVRFLLSKGANPRLKNQRGQTAIDVARVHKNLPIEALLKSEMAAKPRK